MRSSQRPVQQRLAAYSRRRRLMLSYEQPASLPTEQQLLQEISLLDPRTLGVIHTLAHYLNEHRNEVESLVQIASQLVSGPTLDRFSRPEFLEQLSVPVSQPAGLLSEPADERAGSASLALRKPQPVGQSVKMSPAVASPSSGSEKVFGNSPGINRIRGWLQTEPSRVWMFVGDDITAWMRYHSQPGYAEMFRHRLRWELKRYSDVVVNAGTQRATVNDLHKITRQGMAQCRPDVVFVMPGQNDLPFLRHPSLYSEQLIALAELIRSQGAEPVFQTPPVPHDLAQSGHSLPIAQLADVVREISVVHEIPLIDHAEFWMEQPSCLEWYDSQTNLLNSTGQAALTLQFFSELDIFDRQSPLCARLQLL